jgi:DNA-binding transcriptional ArsR family regulator
LGIETCYPGHGRSFGEPNAIIDRILARHEQRNQQILAMLSDQPVTPYELACQLFPGLDIRMLHLGLSVAVGHLEALEERGQVASVQRDGLCYYRRVETEE